MSKELEALNDLYYNIVEFLDEEYSESVEEERNIHYKQNYELVKKSLKVLEIIKRNPQMIIKDIEIYSSWEEWCEDWIPEPDSFNSKEEFDLLKEVLL